MKIQIEFAYNTKRDTYPEDHSAAWKALFDGEMETLVRESIKHLIQTEPDGSKPMVARLVVLRTKEDTNLLG